MAEMSGVLRGLSRSYLFDGLDPEELTPLALAARVRTLGRGEYLFHVGDAAEEIYVVLSGELQDEVIGADGEAIVHFVHGAGMTVGEAGYFAVERHRIISVVALQPASVARLARRDLVPFMDRHSCVKDRALEGLASHTRWQTTMISSLATRPLTDRLALRLLELADTGPRGPGPPVTPRVSQAALAAMVGASREHVNRALAALAARGLIRQDRGRYVLLDEARLREQASPGPIVVRRDRRV